MNMHKPHALLLALTLGCSAGPSYTVVEKRLKPSHFKFLPVVEKTEPGAGGWRAACVHFHLRHDDGRAYICKVGVEVPMETKEGPISITRAQRVCASCANLAADLAFSGTTAETPLGIACTLFIQTYNATLWRALEGTRVNSYCRAEAESASSP